MFRRFAFFALISMFAVMFTGIAMAANSDSHSVTFEVVAINEITVTGSPSLTVNAATAGSQPTEVTDSTTTKYAITTNQSRKINAAIDTAMPTGVTLKVNVTAPGTGSSVGDVPLSASSQDVVTGITPVVGSNLTITYKLSALVTAGVVASASRTVTFTIVASP